jgi:hypothetical protein
MRNRPLYRRRGTEVLSRNFLFLSLGTVLENMPFAVGTGYQSFCPQKMSRHFQPRLSVNKLTRFPKLSTPMQKIHL